jgi:light-regulated signal transduction histidine kinase (bacteriophytochrome)
MAPSRSTPARTDRSAAPAPASGAATTVPGEIQPHGFLVGVDPKTSVITLVSQNLRSFLDVDPADALGSTLTDLLGSALAGRLAISDHGRQGETQPRLVRLPPLPPSSIGSAVGPGSAREPWDEFEVVAHLNGAVWILEFEPVADNQSGRGSLYNSFRRTLDHLRTIEGVAELCRAAAQEVRELTGYDRVLVYRFDAEAQGDVVAESRRADVDPFLGLSYPAADIPGPARALYLRNWLRLIADVDDEPAGLLAAAGLPAPADVDLSMAVLASPTTEDREYLRNMGVAATMTVSLVVDGRLWGLIACQHRTPRRVSQHVRSSCEMLGRVLSLQVRAAQARLEHERVLRLDVLVAQTVTAMSLANSLAAGAAEVPEALLGIVAADGVVLQVEGRRITAGRTPSGDALDRLVAQVSALAAREVPPWSTDCLPDLLSSTGAAGFAGAESATGVLYLPLDGRGNGYVLWLRGEELRTVSWAGGLEALVSTGLDPITDPTEPSADSGELSDPELPRTSFAAWDELVRGTSRPWLPAERAAAEAFASALPALLLHRAQRVLIEQELTASADRLSAAADKQHLEHQLQQHQRLESLGQLAGGVAHDFNNLLAVILNYVEFIGEEIDVEARVTEGDRWKAVQEDVEQVKAATARAADLTRQLLTFARREVVRPRALNLNHVVRGLEHLLRRSIGGRVVLTTDLADHLHLILADPGQIEQILVNLAVNARDAMPGGGTLSIETSDENVPVARGPGDWSSTSGGGTSDDRSQAPRPQRGRFVRLRVRDTGTGIPQEIIDRVFEPFFTTKPTGDGTGLGLATVHGIVAQVGGTIDISSEPGIGTTFTMVFPATDVAPNEAERPAENRPRAGGETILIVEDGNDLREVTRRLLSRSGYVVLTAANGYEAIDQAAHHGSPIDLLLTDLIMPFMTGDEVAARMRELYPDIRVLFMSGYAAPVLAAGGRLAPEHPMLDKPFSRSTLLIKVLEVLDEPPLQIIPGPAPVG